MKNAKFCLSRFLFTVLAVLFFQIPLQSSLAEEAKEEEIGNYRREGIDVVQRRIFRKTFRHEFAFDVGVIADNTFLLYEILQGRYTFHFRETLAFEATYGRAFDQDKSIISDLGTIPCPSPNSDLDGDGNPDPNCGITLNPPPDPIRNIYFGNIVWSPIYGKFSIFSKKIYHFDLYILAGAGMFDTQRSNRFGFNVGLGGKIFLNDWLTVRLDFRNITVREGAPFSNIVNNRIISLGVSAFLPTKPYE